MTFLKTRIFASLLLLPAALLLSVSCDRIASVKPAGTLKLRESTDIKDGMVGLNVFGDDEVRIARELGAHFIRFDMRWNDVEPVKGSFDYGKYDKVVNEMKASRLAGLAILCYGNRLYGGSASIMKEEGMAGWRRYVRETVSRYKDDISWWEVWNEANMKEYFPHDVNSYVALLKETSKIIRELQPQATVCMTGTADVDFNFLRKALDLGAASHIDVVAYHPYRQMPEESSASSYQETVARLRALADSYDKRLKVWNSEHGMQSALPTSGYKASVCSSELMQAKYHLRRLVLEQSLGLERSVVFYARDMKMLHDPALGEITNTKGLVSADMKPKHAFFAIRNFNAVFDSSIKPAKFGVRVDAMSHPGADADVDAVEIEAEDAAEIIPPMVVMKDAAASGGAFISTPESEEPCKVRRETDKYIKGKNDEKGCAGYKFNLKEDGDYYVFGRVKAPRMSSTSDSFFVRIDGGAETIWDTPETGDRWDWMPVISREGKGSAATSPMPLKAGPHTLKIRTREDGTCLDKMAISKSASKFIRDAMEDAPVVTAAFETPSGAPLACVWKATRMIDWLNVQTATATIEIETDRIKRPVLIDLLDKERKVYELTDFKTDGRSIVIGGVPVFDYPAVIIDMDSAPLLK